MAKEEAHSYRCPVCGHSDSVDLVAGAPQTVSCSHCQTRLELRVNAESSDRVSVVVLRSES